MLAPPFSRLPQESLFDSRIQENSAFSIPRFNDAGAMASSAFKVVCQFRQEDEGGPILSTIAVANGHLFVRTPQSLYRIGAKR